ncbi:serine-threonine/tyrosine-protein kinase catalytic domain-containing protein [Artemisia annua]|uniref:Serine-threonine/tyrosine-protein kinase catalytic domain-containing protein n=1 Tax=Artemisia annua TaxID=35608 RepID=A0A2U1KW68_ARTAN|nr:serine-threonine/tyrosine-protein kinase catalytic domain-containing protein [Artemisia annua]
MLPSNCHKARSFLSLELSEPCCRLTFYEIQKATNYFDESLVIGRGGFGKVYKGTISNGERRLVVAIKRLDSTSNQGAEEFWAEVEMLSKLRHCHLVSLIGYFLCGKQAVDGSLDEEQWGLARWAQNYVKEGRMKQIVDSRIRERISPKCLKEFARIADRCLHTHPKDRPTMAEVVFGLESILASQENANTTWQPARGVTVFGRKVPMFVFTSTGKNSDRERSLKFLEVHFDSIQGENPIFSRFDFNTINIATTNFSDANKVDDGYYSIMYKGRLQNGHDIAISKLTRNHPSHIQYYMNEASILVKLEHDNLVKLVGYCIKGSEVFLIYEFAHHSRLDRLIFDPMCTLLDWNKRGYIAPEDFVENLVSIKSDVYGFGILVLETISGRRPYECTPGTYENPKRQVEINWMEGTCNEVEVCQGDM